jgi:hypothetical protein
MGKERKTDNATLFQHFDTSQLFTVEVAGGFENEVHHLP